ncbi:hypothetical protein BU25DRAFT_491339 [Macroventuria anomochaeta]|uniref:Uncharacterized protein n=1 Tax=Macroventuria anomochaeta TaxID=301207 RepID=A0ACB6S2A0_9PLEO|nr:uncharacterized protein BU25DRAFT_491339 [Macroventuria anomochaeta]KAF2627262.1 hypothetical protein BU25DRAFT_491339 [Macroventuria anomochaeta]
MSQTVYNEQKRQASSRAVVNHNGCYACVSSVIGSITRAAGGDRAALTEVVVCRHKQVKDRSYSARDYLNKLWLPKGVDVDDLLPCEQCSTMSRPCHQVPEDTVDDVVAFLEFVWDDAINALPTGRLTVNTIDISGYEPAKIAAAKVMADALQSNILVITKGACRGCDATPLHAGYADFVDTGAVVPTAEMERKRKLKVVEASSLPSTPQKAPHTSSSASIASAEALKGIYNQLNLLADRIAAGKHLKRGVEQREFRLAWDAANPANRYFSGSE